VGIRARVLVVGNDLLAGALASALTAHGFSTLQVPQGEARMGRGIGWRPSIVLLDAGSLEVADGAALVGTFCGVGLRVCVIDAGGSASRLRVWKESGAVALVDRSAAFDELFRTLKRILEMRSPAQFVQPMSASMALSSPAGSSCDSSLDPFAVLTEREQFVLAELIEGHCAEEIASAAFVSISTVRSHIKSILQKLGVSSQLAAVALARRAGWSFEKASVRAPGDSGSRRADAV
jgi:DNA-binding NarL/FixJ family response regulator